MNARRVNAAAGVICAAQKQGKTLAAPLAAALDAAGMLMSPETAAELDSLRKQVVSRDEHTAHLAECLVARTGELATAQAQVAELEAQRERRRVRLVALQNDASNMRGSLSPNGEARKVPFELGETLTPAVDWLIGRVAEQRQRIDELVQQRDDLLAETATASAPQHDRMVDAADTLRRVRTEAPGGAK